MLPDGTPVNKDPSKIRRFKFTPEDDAKLEQIIKHSPLPINWKNVSILMKTRSPRQCRERYNSHLSHKIGDPSWTNEEIEILHKQVSLWGRKWNIIADFLPRHTPVCIKYMWKHTISNREKNGFTSQYAKPIDNVEEEKTVDNKEQAISIFQFLDSVFDEFSEYNFF